ncbi:hypothetical protein DFH09DRAFT_1100581 [Mycena vulgaris]|nr:hypothetical protein DFH09DRAFT_1100581 [Mycena vulgaris]
MRKALHRRTDHKDTGSSTATGKFVNSFWRGIRSRSYFRRSNPAKIDSSLKVQVPYTGGVHPVKAEDLVGYHSTDEKGNTRSIDLGTATGDELEAMAAVCQPATFGVNQSDVLDKVYRKAGEMNLARFSARLDGVASGLIDAPEMLDGQDASGRGSWLVLQSAQGYPRKEDTIGSLVVVFPIAHKGGAFTFSHGGNNWTFDSAAELATQPPRPPSHTPRSTAIAPIHRIPPIPERTFEDVLRALLADHTFLPEGGLFAYGLAHQYPMPAHGRATCTWVKGKQQPEMKTSLAFVLQMLKGSDARIRTVSQRVSLDTHVKVLYNSGENYSGGGHDVLADHVLNIEVNEEYDMNLQDEIEKMGVIFHRGEERMEYLKKKGLDRRWRTEKEKPNKALPVPWVTRITDLNHHVYGNAALFVSVPAVEEGIRSAA